MRRLLLYMKSRYVDPKYLFKDRLYFLFGTAGLFSAGAAFLAAVCSGLPWVAAAASLFSFFVMFILMAASFCMKDISVNRVVCSLFLNFFMFPALFWVTGGVNCGMVFYFILGLSVAALILDGAARILILAAALIFDTVWLYLGFRYPQAAFPLTYEARAMDTVSSFCIVSVFIIAVILIMSIEYQKEHNKVLENAEVLRLQALTDNLTTLYNQRYLSGALEQLARAYAEDGKSASIILLDIDDFKKVNDTYGHLRGNQVLCQFAAILKEQAGDAYIASRYGGEEFIVALPGQGRETAAEAAESIRRQAFEDTVLAGLTGGSFSVSGGVAQYQGGTVEEWIRRADANLYCAKRDGKNRIVG